MDTTWFLVWMPFACAGNLHGRCLDNLETLYNYTSVLETLGGLRQLVVKVSSLGFHVVLETVPVV